MDDKPFTFKDLMEALNAPPYIMPKMTLTELVQAMQKMYYKNTKNEKYYFTKRRRCK